MLQAIWQTRLTQHINTLLHQFKYIFNDHFSLVIVFLIGLSSYSYAQWLNTVNLIPHQLLVLGIVSVISVIVLNVTSLATLLQEQDRLYLHHQETQFYAYFKRAFLYSLIQPIIYIVSLFVVLLPLFAKINYVVSPVFAFTLFGLKCVQLLFIWQTLYNTQNSSHQHIKLTVARYSIVYALIIVLLWHEWIAFILTLSVIFVLWQLVKKQTHLNWDYIITLEKQRQFRNKQLLKLFIDSDDDELTVKPLFIIERLLLKRNTDKPSLLLWQRHLFRLSHYRQLTLRLTVLFGVISLLLQDAFTLMLLSGGVLFLTIIQLIPAYQHYTNHLLFLQLPIDKKQHQVQFQQALQQLTSVQLIVMVSYFFMKLPFVNAVINTVILFIFNFVLQTLYVQQKIAKITK